MLGLILHMLSKSCLPKLHPSSQTLMRGFRVVVKLKVFIGIKCLDARLAQFKW